MRLINPDWLQILDTNSILYKNKVYLREKGRVSSREE